MLNTEVWESEGSIGNHPIIRVKSGALKNVGRKHFGEKLIKNGGGTRGGAGVGKSGGWQRRRENGRGLVRPKDNIWSGKPKRIIGGGN